MKSKLFLMLTSFCLILGLSSCKKDEATNPPDKPNLPTACFTISNSNVDIGYPISFDADCSKDAISYEWDLGDGNTRTESEAYFTWYYEEAGSYTVKLTIKNKDGSTAFTTKTIKVTNQFKKFEGKWDIVEDYPGFGTYNYVSTITVSNNGTLTISNFGDFRATVSLKSTGILRFEGKQLVDISSGYYMSNSLIFNDVTNPFQFTCDAFYEDGEDDFYTTISGIKQ